MISLLSPFTFFCSGKRRLLPSFTFNPSVFGLCTMAWVAVGSAVVGAGASIYGANKNASAQRDANAANIAAQQEANKQAYAQWLMTRGIGQNGEPVNTRMPLWATASSNLGLPKTARRFRRIGTGAPAANLAAAYTPPGSSLYPAAAAQPVAYGNGSVDSTSPQS